MTLYPVSTNFFIKGQFQSSTITAVQTSGVVRGSGTNGMLTTSATLPISTPNNVNNSSSSNIDLKVVAVVLAYGLSSLSGVFVNKACLSAYSFGYTVTLLLSQLCVSVTTLTFLRLTRIVVIPHRPVRELVPLIFTAVFFIANVTVGLLALKLVNIPMFSAFRRLSVLSVMLLEWIVLGKTASQRILSTIFIMVLGSFLAGLGDLAFDPTGYILVFVNNFITAANLVSIKKASAMLSLDALSLFYYVSIVSLPVVFVLAALSGELRLAIHEIMSRPDLQTTGFAFALSLSAGSAFLINFFTNMCTQLTSPLTTAITGQMKNVLQTVLGIFAFGYVVTPLNLFGLGVALVGSLAFARFKYDDAKVANSGRKSRKDKDESTNLSKSSVLMPLHPKSITSPRYKESHDQAHVAADEEKLNLLRHSRS